MRGRRTSVETQCIESLAAAPRRHDRTEAASEVSEYSQNERSQRVRARNHSCAPRRMSAGRDGSQHGPRVEMRRRQKERRRSAFAAVW